MREEAKTKALSWELRQPGGNIRLQITIGPVNSNHSHKPKRSDQTYIQYAETYGPCLDLVSDKFSWIPAL